MSSQRYFVARISGQEGPLSADEVRAGLRSGRYRPTDLSWAEQGDHLWIPLSERPELATRGRQAEPTVDPVFAEPEPRPVAPKLPEMVSGTAESSGYKPLPPELAAKLTPEQWQMAQRAAIAWRRFLARSVDIGVAGVLLNLLIGIDPEQPLPTLEMSLLIVALWPWAEAVLLSTVGNTPGKALLRLRVVNLEGGRPHFMQALMRSVWVWIQGMALGLPFASQIANILAFNRYTREDRTAWDERAATRLLVMPISQLRMTLIVAVFIGSAIASVMLTTGRL